MMIKTNANVMLKSSAVAFRSPFVRVECPSGMKLTGGGGSCQDLGNRSWTFMTKSYPVNDSQWEVRCDSAEPQDVKAEVYIFCS